jgi:CDP-diacylglycerol--glycerol-3-phosphate 3-phosphatidyltransferase
VNARRDSGTAILTRITLARVVLVPVIMALVLVGDDVGGAYVLAALAFVVAAITDFFDGYLARRWALTTTLGAFLDTTADKLLVGGVLIALVAVDRASPWVAAIVVGRELAVLGLRGVVAAGGQVIAPSIWGKVKANVQCGAVFLAILRTAEPLGPLYLDEYAMIVAAVVTVLSAVEYFGRFWTMLEPTRADE